MKTDTDAPPFRRESGLVHAGLVLLAAQLTEQFQHEPDDEKRGRLYDEKKEVEALLAEIADRRTPRWKARETTTDAVPGKPQLFEISALVSYHAVILAVSWEDAMKEVRTWEQAWHDTADLVEVSDVEPFHVRPYTGTMRHYPDEAHDYTQAAAAAQKLLDAAKGDE